MYPEGWAPRDKLSVRHPRATAGHPMVPEHDWVALTLCMLERLEDDSSACGLLTEHALALCEAVGRAWAGDEQPLWRHLLTRHVVRAPSDIPAMGTGSPPRAH